MENKSTLRDYKITCGKIKGDFQISFKLFRKNFLPFFIILLIGTVIYYAVNISLRIVFYENLIYTIPPEYISLIYSLIKLPSDALLLGFFGCSMGLAYDVISSGDEFAEIKSSIYYIREYWLKFFLFGFISNCFIYVFRFIDPGTLSLEILLFIRLFSAVLYITLSETNASLVSTGNLLTALQENFIILRKNFGRIVITFGLYFAVFLLPRSITGVLYTIYEWPSYGFTEPLYMTIQILTLIYIFIGFPIFAFLSLGIYNSEYRFKNIH